MALPNSLSICSSVSKRTESLGGGSPMRIMDVFAFVGEPFVDLVGDDVHDPIADERQHDRVVVPRFLGDRFAPVLDEVYSAKDQPLERRAQYI
jgi:hypothetical protein